METIDYDILLHSYYEEFFDNGLSEITDEILQKILIHFPEYVRKIVESNDKYYLELFCANSKLEFYNTPNKEILEKYGNK